MANRDYTIAAPDGREVTINGPEDATPDQLRQAAQRALSMMGPKKEPGILEKGGMAQNVAGGILRGAGSIGATLLAPIDYIHDKIDPQQNLSGLITGQKPLSRNERRRKDMADALRMAGVDTDSTGYQVGKIGTEVAGTLGVGGALAPTVARVAPALAPAVASGGFAGGSLPMRAAGGAVTGAASAGLINPDDALTGAAVGGALPVIAKAAGAVGKGVGSAVGITSAELKALFQKDSVRGAQELMKALDVTPEQLPAVIAQLRGAKTLVEGAAPTVAQALDAPQAAILQRIVAAGPGGEKLRVALAQQAEARMNALNSVAPIDPNGARTALEDTGGAIARFAKSERGLADAANKAQYQGIDPNGAARVVLPAEEFRSAASKFVGRGAIGENTMPGAFAREAAALSAPEEQIASGVLYGSGARAPAPRASDWNEVLRMRSSLNEQIQGAMNNGDKQAAAALMAQKQSLDVAIEKQLPPEVLAKWQEANASRAAMGQRFDNGPQASIFSTRNGEPIKQSGEVARLFWGNRPGLAEDVQAFRRLINDNQALLGQFKSMVTTEGAATAGADAALGQRFVNWTKNQLPGLREAFSPAEVQKLQNIADDVQRAINASKRGMGPGSNTYQNAVTALDAGLLDSPLVKAASSRIPFLNTLTEPGRAALAEQASKGKAVRLSDLLIDSRAAADALAAIPSQSFRRPVPLSALVNPQLAQFGYRAAPAIGADR
jgi:hypothetical protein